MERVNNVFQFTDDFTFLSGRHSWKFGVDVRRENMKIAFINRPNGDLTFSGGITGNAAADFLLGLPAQARATTTQAIQDGHGWLYSALRAGRVPPEPAAHPEPRRALRAAHCRSWTRTTPSPASTPACSRTKFPAAPAGLVYPGDPGRAARRRANGQEQPRAAAGGGLGSQRPRPHQRARGLGALLRRAGRAGRLLPERRPVAAVHAAGGAEHAHADHDREPARRAHRRAAALPRRPDHHRLGGRLPVARTRTTTTSAVQQQVGRQPRGRGGLRRLARQTPADLHGDQPRRLRARADHARRAASCPAFSLVRPTFSVGGVLVRRAAEPALRLRPTAA